MILVSQFDGMLKALGQERSLAVLLLAKLAESQGLTVGRKADPEASLMWRNLIFIDLPTGQVSWHIHKDEWNDFLRFPLYKGEWDGHDKATRNQRIMDYVRS